MGVTFRGYVLLERMERRLTMELSRFIGCSSNFTCINRSYKFDFSRFCLQNFVNRGGTRGKCCNLIEIISRNIPAVEKEGEF